MKVLDSTHDLEILKKWAGGKAYSLSLLNRWNYPVAPWIVLCDFCEITFEELGKILHQYKLSDYQVAIRSSANKEDSENFSFAGLFKSIMPRRGVKEIHAALTEVLMSVSESQVQYYCEKNQIDFKSLKMSVIIQVYVPAEIAGVAFSFSPKRNDFQKGLISYVHGTGEKLVSGQETSIDIEFDRDQETVISDKNFQQLKTYLIELERKVSSALDIEWAVIDSKVILLQMRPMTQTPPLQLIHQQLSGTNPIYWDSSNIGESYSGITLPISISVAKMGYQQFFNEVVKYLNFPVSIQNKAFELTQNLIEGIGGRVYYNYSSWLSMMSLLPGKTDFGTYLTQMIGSKNLSNEQKDKIQSIQWKKQKYSILENLKIQFKFLWFLTTRQFRVQEFLYNFQKIYNERRTEKLPTNSLDMMKHMNQFNQQIIKIWRICSLNDLLSVIMVGIIKKGLARKYSEQEASQFMRQLTILGEGVDTIRMNHLLESLINKIKANANLKIKILSLEIHELQKDYEFLTIIKPYIDQFGFRIPDELKIESIDYHINNSQFISIIKTRIQREIKPLTVAGKSPFVCKSFFLKIKIKFYQNVLRDRENMRMRRAMLTSINRRYLRHLGDLLVYENKIKQTEDLFYFTLDEIFNHQFSSQHLNEIYERKRKYTQFNRYRNLPVRFLSYGQIKELEMFPQLLTIHSLDTSGEKKCEGGFLGEGCSPGKIQGIIYHVRDLAKDTEWNDKIVIAEQTDPGWIMIFGGIRGLIIEKGSVLSHAAITAREFQVPAVVNLHRAFDIIPNGSQVEIDGQTGKVSIL